jgi:uncharacterized protein YukE
MMGGSFDAKMLQDQQKIDQQAAAQNAQTYNPDGSGKANDYHPPAMPQSTFPPTLTAGSDFKVNRDELTQVASQMGKDLASLNAALQTLGNGGAGGSTVGGWETADGFGNNSGQAWWGIYSFVQELNGVYDQVIGYLHQTAANYNDAEQTTAAAASNVGADAAPSGLA